MNFHVVVVQRLGRPAYTKEVGGSKPPLLQKLFSFFFLFSFSCFALLPHASRVIKVGAMPPFFVSFSLSLVAPPLPPSLSLSFVFYLAFLCCRLLCCLLPGPQVRQGFGSGCWLPLGSAMGPRCACRGEAGVVRGGRGADGRGGHGSLVPSPHHVILL